MGVTLGKSSAAAALVNPDGSKIGTGGTVYYIKMQKFRTRFGTLVEETTGSGDLIPRFESNEHVYANGTIYGAMIASQALGIANLIAANSPSSGAFVGNEQAIPIVIYLTNNRELNMNVLVHDIDIDWDRRRAGGSYVRVAMSYTMTDTTVSGIESDV